MVEFLMPGSTPIKCDKQLVTALPATLIQWLIAFAPQPLLVFGASLLGCGGDIDDFPDDTKNRCALGERSALGWVPVFVWLVLATQSLTFCLHASAYYLAAPLKARRMLRMLDDAFYCAVALAGILYFTLLVLWLVLSMLVAPWAALPTLLLLLTVVLYCAIIGVGLIKTVCPAATPSPPQRHGLAHTCACACTCHNILSLG
jgi:hypothetical protein